MADTVIIDIQVSNAEAVKELEQSADRISELKKEEAALREERRKQTITQEEYLKKLTANREEMERHQQSMRSYRKAIKDNVRMERENADSLNNMRKSLRLMLKEFDSMSKAEREGAKGKELLTKIQGLTDELNAAEQASGRFQRNVGNYESAIKNLPGKLNEWAVALNNAQKNGGQLSMTFGIMKNGAKAFGDTLKMLATNPFFIILRVAIGLFTAFKTQVKKSDDAMTALQSVTASLKPVMDTLRAVLEGIVKAFTGIVNGITGALTKLGEWLGLSKDTIDANQDLVKSMDELEESERKYTVSSAKRSAKISEYREKANDAESYTINTRIFWLEQAMLLEQKELKQRQAIAAERLRLARVEAALNKDNSDETKNRIAELEAEVVRAEQSYNESMRSLEKQRQALKKQGEAEQRQRKEQRNREAKEAAAARREALSKEREALRALQDARLAMMAEGEDKEVEVRKVQYERQAEDLRRRLQTEKNMTAKTREALNEQLTLMEAKYQLDVADIRAKAAEQRKQAEAETERQAAENRKRIAEIGMQAWLQEQQNALDKQLQQVRDNAAETAKVMQQDAQRQLDIAKAKQGEIRAENYATAEEYRKAMADATAAVIEAENKVYEATKATTEAMRETQQATIDATKGIADAFGTITQNMQNLFETLAQTDERYNKYANAMAYLQILISTAVSIANAIQGATAAAASTGVAAPLTLPTFIAEMVGIVTGAVAQASALLLKGKNTPKYADGGVIRGAGSGTSDSITARVSNGESVMTAKATAMFYDQLSAMNVAGGGRPFDNVGGRRFARGGVVSTSTVLSGRQMQAMADIMREAMEGVQPVVSVREIASVQRRIQIKENIAKR